MNVEKKEHPVWKEMVNTDCSIIGKYQHIFSNEKGRMSMIELPNYFRDGIDLWEIYCLEGELFDDIERFNTPENAIKRVYELLGETYKPLK